MTAYTLPITVRPYLPATKIHLDPDAIASLSTPPKGVIKK